MVYVILLAHKFELQDDVSFVLMYPIFSPEENCLILDYVLSPLFSHQPKNFSLKPCIIVFLTPTSNTSYSALTIYSGVMRKQRKQALIKLLQQLTRRRTRAPGDVHNLSLQAGKHELRRWRKQMSRQSRA